MITTFHTAEEGAVMVLVVLSAVVVFGAITLAVDAGNVWVVRRTLTGGTDAAALAAAASYGRGDGSLTCGSSELRVLLEDNSEGASITDCAPESTGASSGHVAVAAESAPIEVGFRQALGSGDPTVTATSTAMWGLVDRADGIRPIAVCLSSEHVQGWLGTGTDTGEHPAPGVHRLRRFETTGSGDSGIRSGCGWTEPLPGPPNGPPNWAFIDPSGSGDVAADLPAWLDSGYPEMVALGDCDADGTPDAGCPAFEDEPTSATANALRRLRDADATVVVVAFEATTEGPPRTYEVAAFLGVEIEGFRITGPEADRYLDLRFTRVIAEGPCCVTSAPDTGVRGVRLCAVSGEPDDRSTNCVPREVAS